LQRANGKERNKIKRTNFLIFSFVGKPHGKKLLHPLRSSGEKKMQLIGVDDGRIAANHTKTFNKNNEQPNM
jgi:hypothetical protein